MKEGRFSFLNIFSEIVTFFYYANKEIKTLNREYLQNITAVFFSNKKNSLTCTAYVLLPCLPFCKKTKQKQNKTNIRVCGP